MLTAMALAGAAAMGAVALLFGAPWVADRIERRQYRRRRHKD